MKRLPLILLGIVALLALFGVSAYNSIQTKDEAAAAAKQ